MVTPKVSGNVIIICLSDQTKFRTSMCDFSWIVLKYMCGGGIMLCKARGFCVTIQTNCLPRELTQSFRTTKYNFTPSLSKQLFPKGYSNTINSLPEMYAHDLMYSPLLSNSPRINKFRSQGRWWRFCAFQKQWLLSAVHIQLRRRQHGTNL